MINNAVRARQVIVLLLCISVVFSAGSAAAADLSEIPVRDKYSQGGSVIISEDNENNAAYYFEVISSYKKNGYHNYKGENIVISASEYSKASSQIKTEVIEGKQAVICDEKTEWIEWEFEVPEDALYQINMDVYCPDDSGVNSIRKLILDGAVPFKEAAQIEFRWNWEDAGEIMQNNIGDEISPSQKLKKQWNSTALSDRDGTYSEPFVFYLTKGKHTICLEYIDRGIAVSSIMLSQPEDIISYSEAEKIYKEKNYSYATEGVRFEAEANISDKNSNVLKYVANDDPSTTPYKQGYKRMNTIGDTYWSKGGQTIEWKFEVPSDGLYKIGMRVVEWYNYGQASFRQIKIDGEVPFEEFKAYKFEYGADWRGEYLSDEKGEPYYVYLKAGKSHTISMTVVLGDYGIITKELAEAAEKLSDLMLRITMITGPNPDRNYEYELEKQIPGLLTDFSDIKEVIEKSADSIKKIAGKVTTAESSLRQTAAQLDSVIKNPDSIVKRIDNLNNSQANIVTWYTDLKSQPLLIDYFVIDKKDGEINNAKSGFKKKLVATINNFIISFSKDYDSIGGTAGETKSIKIFTTLGNERGEILKMMADKSFTTKTGYSLDLKIVPQGQVNAGQVNALMLSIMSGRAPDAAIGVDTASPPEFAFRESAADLSGLPGFDEIKKNFVDTAFDSLTFNGGVYGIPESMDFRVLMYRTDIAEKTGFLIPDTWEDLYSVTLPVLNQNKLNFYMPQEYGIFLYQNGGRYYTEDGLSSALDSPEAYIAFKEMIDVYTSYGVPYSASFFNRFRSGEIPIGVAGFTEYIQVLTAAPELSGKWAIALLPGKKQPDGTMNRSYTKAVKTTGMIFTQSSKQDVAWEFLKWWMSTETQTEYANSVEAYLGPEARWNSANINAYSNTPWNTSDLKIINEMWNYAKEVQPVLGGYFTDRHFNNAWNRIIVQTNSSITPRDSLEMAAEDINKELIKKQKEYSHLFLSQ